MIKLFFSICICLCLSAHIWAQTAIQAKAVEAKSYCNQNKLNTNYCILIDMSIHSGKYRMFVWDFNQNKVVLQSLCAHGVGLGSTQETPVFSNTPGSYCTSVGKYKTGLRAYSNYGIHVHYKLHGLESTNSNAYKRIMVLHSYAYVPEQEIYPEHLPLGYSLGCPVISNSSMTYVDSLLKKTTVPLLVWIYQD